LKTLLSRDKQKLYKNAINGKIKNVVGVDIKFNRPIKSTIVIDNNKNFKDVSPIVKVIEKKLKIR
jgi:adenylylsulfate kinase